MRDGNELHENQDDVPSLITRIEWNLPPVMWRDIEKVRRVSRRKNRGVGFEA